MKKLDYFLIVMIMIIILVLFAVYQIATNSEILHYLVKVKLISNSKETLKNVILTFYSLLAILFVILAIFLIRILGKLFRG